MNNRIDQFAKGMLSLAVILMFAAALVADQARANLPEDATAPADFSESARGGILLDAELLRKIDSVPSLIGTIFTLPSEVDSCIDSLMPRSRNARPHGSTVK